MRVSADMYVDQGILAGNSATSLICRCLLDVLVDASCLYPSISLYSVVDDITVGAVDKRKHVINRVLGATRSICIQLELVGFTISTNKNIVMGSSAQVVQVIRMGLRAWDFKGLGATKNLGVAFAGARKRSTKDQTRRWQSLLPRLSRFRSLASSFSGMHRILKTGGAPTAFYGVRVLDMEFDKWDIGDGISLHLSSFGRHSVEALVVQGTYRQLLRHVAIPSPDGVPKPPLITVIREELQSFRKGGNPKAAIFISGVIAGGYPCQLQLYRDIKVIAPLCLACGQAEGTPKHRLYGCPGSHLVRRDLDLDGVVREGAGRPECDLMVPRVLVPDPGADWPTLSMASSRLWHRRPASDLLGPRLCVDGSGLDQDNPLSARA
ncbi:unnamed protein product, partial [Prorocentrum cordatum]